MRVLSHARDVTSSQIDVEADKEVMETAAKNPRRRCRSLSSPTEVKPGDISFTRMKPSSDEPPVKRRQGGNDSDQCVLTLLAASEELGKGISASVMRSSKESCEPRHKRCFNNDPYLLALTSASDALKIALTELRTRQSFRLEKTSIDEPLNCNIFGQSAGECQQPCVEQSERRCSKCNERRHEAKNCTKVVAQLYRLNRHLFERFGYSPNCPKCRRYKENDGSLLDPRHTNECRQRIEREISKDPILSQRLAATQQRMDEYLKSQVKQRNTRNVFEDGIEID